MGGELSFGQAAKCEARGRLIARGSGADVSEVEPRASVRGGGRDPACEGKGVGRDGSRVGDGVEQPRRTRRAGVFRAAEGAHEGGGHRRRRALVGLRQRAFERSSQAKNARLLARRRRPSVQVGRRFDGKRIAARVGEADANAAVVRDGRGAYLQRQQVIAGRRLDPNGEPVEHEVGVHRFVDGCIDSVPREAYGSGRGDMHVDGLRGLQGHTRSEIGARLASRLNVERERQTARSNHIGKDAAKRHLIDTPIEPRRSVTEAARGELWSFATRETAPCILKGTEDREGPHESAFVCGRVEAKPRMARPRRRRGHLVAPCKPARVVGQGRARPGDRSKTFDDCSLSDAFVEGCSEEKPSKGVVSVRGGPSQREGERRLRCRVDPSGCTRHFGARARRGGDHRNASAEKDHPSM